MSHRSQDQHVYLRNISEQERTSLSVLAQLIPMKTTVLDIGCGSGALGQYLSQHHTCTVDGITLSEAEAAHARPYYRRIEVADLEIANLLRLFAGQQYDAIVCADVLEHIRQPERILAACRELLTAEGRLLLSIPNAGYCGLLAELLQGEFRYRTEGLLDRTHLRFFTRRSLTRFLREQGWALDSLDTITRALPESEFRTPFDSLPPAVARYLLAQEDALTYQFIGVARPTAASDGAGRESAISATPGAFQDTPPAQASFTAQLFVGQDGTYREDAKLVCAAAMGEPRQTLRFVLPASSAPHPTLRLDPADRPGFLHLHAMALQNAEGANVWQWHAADFAATPLLGARSQQILWCPPLPTAPDTALLLLSGDDPWFELPIPQQVLAQCLSQPGSTLEVTLGWPLSADYLALAAATQPLQHRIAQLEESVAQKNAELLQMQNTAQQVQDAFALVSQKNEHLHAERQELQLQRNELQTRLEQLAAYLHGIETSTIFRATRPLVHAKMWLDRQLGRSPVKASASQRHHPSPMPDHPVDVIVPVYRGLEDTQTCIDSVLASTCTTRYRLIIINDSSPEPEVTAWLRMRAAQDPRILLLENPENLGFVGTVNRGMALSAENDVLLLNSDTEVANDWLDRLRRAAYSDRRIASVTSFSNNATICSYPRFCQDNELPPGHTTASLDALCAQTHPGATLDIPTGIGFCMYIRRDCLRQVGLFDVENFGKGYGEENDFCLRAARAGWRNLHALDTFVLHTGGVSFGASKSPREQAAMETMRRLHPGYESTVHAFVQADPAKPYRLALDIARLKSPGLPAVLFVLHDRAGGTLRHTHELAQQLQNQAVFLTLVPAPDDSVQLKLPSENEAFALQFRLRDQYEELLQMLRHLGVRLVHFHHLLGHAPQVKDLPKQLGVPYDFTVHDYYAICPQISLTDHTNGYCGEQGPSQCHACLRRSPAPGGASIEAWRSTHAEFICNARHILAPSLDAARRIVRYVPTADMRLAPHTDLSPQVALPEPRPLRKLGPEAPLKIVVLGALSIIKGADVLEAVALEAARRNAPVEFHLLGYAYRHLRTQPRARLTVHGEYADKDLPALLEWLQPDLVWFPAQCPETYSYTLSACLQQGLPVAATDLGSFPERLAGRAWSWVHAWNATTSEWLDWFLTLRAHHFCTGEPPQPPATVHPMSDEALVHRWNYQHDYLQGLPAKAAAPLAFQPDLEFIAAHLPHASSAANAKSFLLARLIRLRSAPSLRAVARRIPLRWQTRVKTWLQK